MLEQLRNPTPCFREVIHKHFWLKRHEVLKQCENWIAEMESYSNDKRTGRTIAHSTLALKVGIFSFTVKTYIFLLGDQSFGDQSFISNQSYINQ